MGIWCVGGGWGGALGVGMCLHKSTVESSFRKKKMFMKGTH